MSVSLDGLKEGDILAALPPSVAKSVAELEAAGADFETVGSVLANTPAAGVAMKGVTWKSTLWQAVRTEFQSFLCTESEAYADLREDWKTLKARGSMIVVSTLSAA